MPRKDGTPTANERKKAARIESNRRYVTDGKDLTEVPGYLLAEIREELADDSTVVALIDAETVRRENEEASV